MDYLKEAIRIARLAGSRIQKLREQNAFSLHNKSHNELVTSADLESNNIIKNEIAKCFPSHKYISEEEFNGENIDVESPTWIVDPIDGTVGYANGHYQVAVSIAFIQSGRVKVGVVHNPFLNETFYASEGLGAYLNDTKITVTNNCTLKQSVIGTGIPHDRENLSNVLSSLAVMLPQIRDIRRLGSPALDICWVACGRLQGFYEGLLYPWDVAAARFIAIMAGASVGNYRHSAEADEAVQIINGRNVLISAPAIYKELQNILNCN